MSVNIDAIRNRPPIIPFPSILLRARSARKSTLSCAMRQARSKLTEAIDIARQYRFPHWLAFAQQWVGSCVKLGNAAVAAARSRADWQLPASLHREANVRL